MYTVLAPEVPCSRMMSEPVMEALDSELKP